MRLLAYLCDMALLSVAAIVLYRVLAAVAGIDLTKIAQAYSTQNRDVLLAMVEDIRLLALFNCIAYLVPGWFYFALFEGSNLQATPGKIFVGLIVAENGRKMEVDTSTKRFFLKNASTIVPMVLLTPLLGGGCFVGLFVPLIFLLVLGFAVFSLINPFFVFFTERRQALHDIIVGSTVIKDRQVQTREVLFCLGLTVAAAILRIVFEVLA